MNINKININQSEPTYNIASEIYDVSYHNNGAVFESLSALLGNDNLSTLIPTPIRCGGMTIRFIQGSEQNANNKYVQYRLMATSFSTTPSDWQGVDDEPTAGSDNLVKSGGVANKLAELKRKTIKNESIDIRERYSKHGFNSSVTIGSSLDFSQLAYNYRDLQVIEVNDLYRIKIKNTRNSVTPYSCVLTDSNYTVIATFKAIDYPDLLDIYIDLYENAYYAVCESGVGVVLEIEATSKLYGGIEKNTININRICNGFIIVDKELSYSEGEVRKNIFFSLSRAYKCELKSISYQSIKNIDVLNSEHKIIGHIYPTSEITTVNLDENVSYIQVYQNTKSAVVIDIEVSVKSVYDRLDEADSNISNARNIASESLAKVETLSNKTIQQVEDFLSNPNVIKDKDDSIGWYYNSSFRDLQMLFGCYANSLKAEKIIEANITDLRQEETNGVVHDATIVTKKINYSSYKGYIISTYNPITNHDYPENTNDNAKTRLLVVELNNSGVSTVTKSVIVGEAGKTYNEGTEKEFTLIAGTGNGTPNAYLVGDILHILFAAIIDSNKDNWTIIHASYDTNTDEFISYDVCKFGDGNWSTKNIYNTLSGEYSNYIKNGSATACPNINSSIAYDSEEGISYIAMGNHTVITNPVIFKSNDFVTWEFVTIPTFTSNCEMNFECATAFYSKDDKKYLYVAVRQKNFPTNASGTESRAYMILSKIDLATNNIVDECIIPDDGSRPCFFNYIYGSTNNLYLIHNVQKRKVCDILKINHVYLRNSIIVQQLYYPINYPSFAKSADNNNCVFVGTQNNRLWLSSGFGMESIALGNESQSVNSDGTLADNTLPYLINKAFENTIFSNL